MSRRLAKLFFSVVMVAVWAAVWAATWSAGCNRRRDVERPAGGTDPRTCYFGKTIAYDSEAHRLGAIETLVVRTVEPSRSRVTEKVINFDPRPAVGDQVFLVVMRVEGDGFEIEEKGGAFRGRGELFGTPWRWSGWRSEQRLAAGGRVVSTVRLEDGVRFAERRHFDREGNLEMIFRQELKRIGSRDCRARLERVSEQ
jgi:hypothetical protein